MNSSQNSSSDIETTIVKEFPIHPKWKKIIVDLAKEQVNSIENPEEWSDILEDWSWFRNPHPWIFETLNLLVRYPASSAFLLANNYIFDKGLDMDEISKKKADILAQKIRRSLYKLHSVGLVTSIVLGPEELGPGRNTVTIWIAPFAKEKEIERSRNFYLAMGGTPGRAAKSDSKTAKDISEHNRKVKVLAIMDKFKEKPQLYEYYKCPKKHPEGFKTPRKPNSSWKKQKYVRKCPECERELVQISHAEFLDLKLKSLCEQWDVKI